MHAWNGPLKKQVGQVYQQVASQGLGQSMA